MPHFSTGSPATLVFLRQRRSHPSVTMTAPGPDEAQIADILTIAARVPDHGKLVPWRFILYRQADGERIGAWLAAHYAQLNGPIEGELLQKELTRFTRAPLVIGVVSKAGEHVKIPVWEQQLSAGAVCMNLVTAAAASGFASQWITEWYSYDAAASRYLGAGEGERFAGFVHIGTPTQPPFERPRPDLSEILSTWTGTD
ncbi:nitroreductase family protein [Roseibium sp. M-1]